MSRAGAASALASRTPPGWAEAVLAEPEALLSDHAHCELGAAAAAQGLCLRSSDDAALVEAAATLALEELRHFRRVHRLLRARGGRLGPARRNPYVEGLAGAARASAGAGSRRLLDRLLVAALIEARSHERFELLAARAAESRAPGARALALLYAELARSEAGHATLFVELARGRWPEAWVRVRLGELAALEAELLAGLPFAPRVHSGPPAFQPGGRTAEMEPAVQAASPSP